VPTGTHLYTFDEAGHLIGEYDFTATPRVRQETVYLGDTPVAVLTQTVAGSPAVFTTAVNYVYTDHIDTPRVITQASDNRMRWRSDQADPFGSAAPNQNPASIGVFNYNPRFPGQFYDVESNLHYNYFRDYDPRIGRYVQSDPIGLRGGINTYSYVENQPTMKVDPTGELAFLLPYVPAAVGWGWGSAAVGAGVPAAVGWGWGSAAVGAGAILAVASIPGDTPRDQIRNPDQSRRGEARCRCKAATNAEGGRGPTPQEWFYAERSGPTVGEAAREACRQANKHIGQAYPGCQGEHCHCVCSENGGPPRPYNPS
jgi:RHS repeat-associated protein